MNWVITNRLLPRLRAATYALRGGFLVRPLVIALLLGAAGALLSDFEDSGLIDLIVESLNNTEQAILKLIKEETGQPIGPGMSIVRQIVHFVDSIVCYIGWLFPLWDSKKQTLADKIMGTVVITVPKQPFNAVALYTTT